MKRWPLLRFVALSVVVSGFVSCRDTGGAAPPGAAPVSSLQAKAADSQAPVTAWVMLKDQRAPTVTAATRRDWRALGRDVYGQLTSRAATSQSTLVTFLSSRGIAHKSFWIVNAVQVTADKATLAEIARRPEVAPGAPRSHLLDPARPQGGGAAPPHRDRVGAEQHPGPGGLGEPSATAVRTSSSPTSTPGSSSTTPRWCSSTGATRATAPSTTTTTGSIRRMPAARPPATRRGTAPTRWGPWSATTGTRAPTRSASPPRRAGSRPRAAAGSTR